jgi:tetratricopeptide (TPR) repeat protein
LDGLSQAKREGQESVRLLPEKGEPHFWLAEAQRLSGDWAHAGEEYREYLRLSNFDSRLAGKLDYWILGLTIGIGKKTRPSQQDIWKDFRNLAYFGLCDCERLLNHFDNAIKYCQCALTYDLHDPFSHYALAISFVDKYNALALKDVGLLVAARKHFNSVIELNPHIEQASASKRDIASIDTVLRKQP